MRIGVVTTVFGNTDPGTAALNTLRVLELVGRSDIPVAIGAERNWRDSRHLAPDVHGADGLGNTDLPAPAAAPIAEPAAELIVRVETGDGPARGMTVADLRGQYCGFPESGEATVRVVLETDRTFGDRLVDRLCIAVPTLGAA